MDNEYIKYEKLSTEIKYEIERLHEKLLDDDNSITIEESMNEWFNTKFDQWLNKRFIHEDNNGNKRKFFRLDVEIPINILDTLLESPEGDPEAIELVGNIVNISRGGLYFKYNRPIEISSIIKVMIDLTGIDKSLENIEALAMVIRCDEMDGDYGIGVMFSSIYESDQKSLDVFILKSLAYHLYSGS